MLSTFYPRSATALDYVAFSQCLETLPWTSAFTDNLDLLGVTRSVVTDQLQAALLGAARSAAIGTAIAAANRISNRFRRAAAVLHVIVTILFLPASRGCNDAAGRKHRICESNMFHELTLTSIAVFASPSSLAFATVILAVFFGYTLTLAASMILAWVIRSQYWGL